jgi:hypothetical protein
MGLRSCFRTRRYSFLKILYNQSHMSGLFERTYQPELISRRGEFYAWFGVSLIGVTWIILILAGQSVPFLLPLLGIPLFLIASIISIGNWVDRKTRISVTVEQIQFSNGLLSVRLVWDEIQIVQVILSPWGKKVEVTGDKAHFSFHTLGEVKAYGRSLGRTGFPEGEYILQQILNRANIKKVEVPGEDSEPSEYFYTRQ